MIAAIFPRSTLRIILCIRLSRRWLRRSKGRVAAVVARGYRSPLPAIPPQRGVAVGDKEALERQLHDIGIGNDHRVLSPDLVHQAQKVDSAEVYIADSREVDLQMPVLPQGANDLVFQFAGMLERYVPLEDDTTSLLRRADRDTHLFVPENVVSAGCDEK